MESVRPGADELPPLLCTSRPVVCISSSRDDKMSIDDELKDIRCDIEINNIIPYLFMEEFVFDER